MDVEEIQTVLGGYTTNELAEKAGVHPSRIRQLLDAGVLRGRKHGRDWVVSRASADRWLQERREDDPQ